MENKNNDQLFNHYNSLGNLNVLNGKQKKEKK